MRVKVIGQMKSGEIKPDIFVLENKLHISWFSLSADASEMKIYFETLWEKVLILQYCRSPFDFGLGVLVQGYLAQHIIMVTHQLLKGMVRTHKI